MNAWLCGMTLALLGSSVRVAAERLPNLSRLPAHYQGTVTDAADGPVYGRVRFPTLSKRAPPVYFVIGDPSQTHYRVRVRENGLSIYRARRRRGKVILAYTPASDPVTLEFSRRGRSFRLYEGGGRLWSAADLHPGPLRLEVFCSGQAVRIPVHKAGPILMSDDFMRSTIGDGDGWTSRSGGWRSRYNARSVASSPNPFICRGYAGETAGVLLTGHVFWNNLTLAVALKPDGYPEAGMVFAWRDERNHGRAVLAKEGNEGTISLVKVRDGKEAVLARRALLYPTRRWSRLEIRLFEEAPVTVSLDGVRLLSGPADWDTFGKAGLLIRNGSGLFDDFLATSTPPQKAGALRRVRAESKTYSRKSPYPKDDRDKHLFRWARDRGAWEPLRPTHDGVAYSGQSFQLPLLGDFEFLTPNSRGKALLILRDWLGKPLHTVPVPKPGRVTLARRGNTLMLNGRTLAASSGAEPLLAGFAAEGGPSGEAVPHEVRSNTVRQEFFENATSAWLPADGHWDTSARWSCQPQWTFFSGFAYDAAVQFSKHRFEGNQVHEFYFGMKDVFRRKYEDRRYARHDVNFSFLTDGRDLFSGYTFLYGGFNNTATYLYRGRKRVATNDKIKFKPFDNTNPKHASYDEHLYWRRFRFEKVGNRLRIFLERDLIFDYVEKEHEIPSGGHVALWTYRNGVMYARLNSSAVAIRLDAQQYLLDPPGREDLLWQPLSPARVRVEPDGEGRVKVTNRFSGGEFALRYDAAQPIDLLRTPRLHLWMDVPEGVKINLHLKVNGAHFVRALTAPTTETYRILGGPSAAQRPATPGWRLLVNKALSAPRVGGSPVKSIRGEWQVDLLREMKKRFPNATSLPLQSLIIGNTSHADYLMAGLSGNAAGATYRLGTPRFTRGAEGNAAAAGANPF